MMLRSERQRAIARTDARLARYSFGFRPIVVPFEANNNSPRTILSPSLGCGGEGVASGPCTGATPELFNASHASEVAQ